MMMRKLMLAVLTLSMMAAPAHAEKNWNSCGALLFFLNRDWKYQDWEKVAPFVEKCNEVWRDCEWIRDRWLKSGVRDPGFACKQRPVQQEPE